MAETLVIDRQFIGGTSGTTAANITITNAHGSSGISTNIGDAVQLTGIGTASDGLYRIDSIPSTTQISVALTATSPRPQIDQYAVNIAPPIEISSESFSTDTTTFTTTLGHGLISGQKFKVTDVNNQNLGSFHVKTKISATQFTSVTTVDLGTPKFIIVDGVASATPLSDKENDTSNTYKQDIVGECTGDYSLDVKIENIRLLPGDYNVKVSKALISEWNNTTLDLTYYIALEP